MLAAVTAFVLAQLYLSHVFADSTQLGGDLGGHMHDAAHLRDVLLPDWRLNGWSQDWFTGYPSLAFYFPLGHLLIVLVDLLLPLNVAAKAVAAIGPAALPVSAYAFGRLSGCDRLTSALLSIGALPLLFQPDLFIAGGSIPASVGGEYAFGLSLALGLVVLGLARRGLRTGRYRALTAGLLAVTGLVHVIPAAVVGIGIVVSALLRSSWARLRWTAAVSAVAAALMGFWALPFLLNHRYTGGPDVLELGPVFTKLTPVWMQPVVVVAVVGVVTMWLREGTSTVTDADKRDDIGTFLVAMAAVAAALFAFYPSGQVWNGRFLPIWCLWISLLAAHQLAWFARVLDERRKQSDRRWATGPPALAQLIAPVVVLVAVVPLWDTRWADGVLTRSSPRASAEDIVRGYERSPYGPTYQSYIDAVRTVARDHGCGRAHAVWDQGGFIGANIVLFWMTPFWTDGCIELTQGLYVESSSTSSFVNLANTRLSPTAASYNPHVQPDFDFDAGLEDLRTLGVRYLIASDIETRFAADRAADLRPVGQSGGADGVSWRIYELADAEVVEPVRYEPVVVGGIDGSRAKWDDTIHRWYRLRKDREVPVATDGPERWQRRPRLTGNLPRRETATTTLSRVRFEHERVSFDVSRTGVPVLVKMSYFPAWKASGADGPWRVAPNQMVVVPTAKTVTLRYGRPPWEPAGWALTLVGVGGLVLLARRRPSSRPATPGTARSGRVPAYGGDSGPSSTAS